MLPHPGLPDESPVGRGRQVLPVPDGQRVEELGPDLLDQLPLVLGERVGGRLQARVENVLRCDGAQSGGEPGVVVTPLPR